VNPESRKAKVKPKKLIMPVMVSEKFRDLLHAKVKAEGRDVSKLVRMLLRERYPDLPED
jgi:hypothetical protein